MKAVIQRVSRASVRVADTTTGSIDRGLLVLLGIHTDDTSDDARWMSDKIVNLRIFPDLAGKMNLSVRDIGAKLLLVSQFTLCGDVRKGRRPSFNEAAEPNEAHALYLACVDFCREYVAVETGQFQEHMEVELVNDGPVTLFVDSQARNRRSRETA